MALPKAPSRAAPAVAAHRRMPRSASDPGVQRHADVAVEAIRAVYKRRHSGRRAHGYGTHSTDCARRLSKDLTGCTVGPHGSATGTELPVPRPQCQTAAAPRVLSFVDPNELHIDLTQVARHRRARQHAATNEPVPECKRAQRALRRTRIKNLMKHKASEK